MSSEFRSNPSNGFFEPANNFCKLNVYSDKELNFECAHLCWFAWHLAEQNVSRPIGEDIEFSYNGLMVVMKYATSFCTSKEYPQ